ncbi:CBS domain-containing protein CBSX5-like [Wolffia australiana]
MAISFLAYEVSDLCIGKPPLESLPVSSTVGEALDSLKRCGGRYLSVWAKGAKSRACVGKVCMVDIVCYLCDEENLKNPSAALSSPISVVFPKDSGCLVKHVARDSSMLEALDLILDGAQTLIVPIRSNGGDFCCLTPEDFARFFLNSIGFFYSVSTLSVDALGIIRRDVPAIGYHEPALSALPLIKLAQLSQIAVAIVTDDGKLVGEISPSAIVGGGETVAAAIATLSTGELMAFVDCGGPSEKAVAAVRARLQANAMTGMLDLIDDGLSSGDEIFVQDSSSSQSSSSSSDEESTARARRREKKNSGSGRCAARTGGRSEEAVVAQPGSSLMAVLIQALAHRVNYVWVVGDDFDLVGVVTLADVLKIFRNLL